MIQYRSTLFIIISALSMMQIGFAADYNPSDATNAFTATVIATELTPTILDWTCLRCPDLVGYTAYHSEVLTVSNNEKFPYSMLYNPTIKKMFIAFPGTSTLQQLLNQQLNLGPISYKLHSISGAQVVKYFYNNYANTIRTPLLARIRAAYRAFPGYEFIFTGHSLGAAITTLAAFDTVKSGIIPSSQVAVYNFGSPRVGNYAFATAVEQAIPEFYRIVHWQDPVPHIPPCALNLAGKCVTKMDPIVGPIQALYGGWAAWHVSTELFYNEANTEYAICAKGEDRSCSGQFRIRDTTWEDHFFYMNRKLNYDQSLITVLDGLTKLRYPSVFPS